MRGVAGEWNLGDAALTSVPMSTRLERAVVSCAWALAVVPGCDRAAEAVGLRDEPPPASTPEEPSEDARALAIAVGSMVPSATAEPEPPSPAVVPAAIPAPAPIEELELWDVGVEWTPGAAYYYGMGEPPETLTVTGKARTRRPVGSKAELTIKATCDDGPDAVTDTELARINDGAGPLPTELTEFRVGAQLFVRNIVPDPTACRIVVALRDKAATPTLRGSISLCWTKGNRTPSPCPAPPQDAAPAWSTRDVQFLPSTELAFGLVAGTGPAPDRLGVRSTCHVGDKHFVEFQYLDSKLIALEPGDVQSFRQPLQSAYEYMRYAECDIEVQAVRFDVEAQKLLGVDSISRQCMRPTGIRAGRCVHGTVEPAAVDPSGAPVEAKLQNANFSSYGGWYGGYAMADLTVRAPLNKDAKVEFIATCGKRVDRMVVYFTTPLELVYPGQSIRAQGSVNGRGRAKPQSCTTEFVLHTKDDVGLEKQWSLDTQCYTREGANTPCPGAKAATPPTGLGMFGIGGLGLSGRGH